MRGFGRASVFVFFGLLAANRAWAVLGESGDSVENDRKALGGARKASVPRASYSIEEIDSDAQRVREYVTSTGVVFGVAWDGLSHPDLNQLLGSYSSEYRQASAATPRVLGRRQSTVKSDHLVVQKWGHMRHLQGRAYDPSLLPAGVRINEIK